MFKKLNLLTAGLVQPLPLLALQALGISLNLKVYKVGTPNSEQDLKNYI